ncbi:hypothetical protein AB1Y20_002097 [Prymnesium parvum]|uniref:3'-5' exonuclease domain-containing protein n=1 Tax=Prymnesium parvum TaxID=97485 RepID=A0AB34J7Z9_PRYPA
MACVRCKRSLPPAESTSLCRRCIARDLSRDALPSSHPPAAARASAAPTRPAPTPPAPTPTTPPAALSPAATARTEAHAASQRKLPPPPRTPAASASPSAPSAPSAPSPSPSAPSPSAPSPSTPSASASALSSGQRNSLKRAARQRKRSLSSQPRALAAPLASPPPAAAAAAQCLRPPPFARAAPASPALAAPPAAAAGAHHCPDCGARFGSKVAQVVHQMLSASPHASGAAAAPSLGLEEPAEGGGGEAAGGGERQYAPKHGVRLIYSALDLTIVTPLLLSEPIVGLDLEGDLTPSATCRIDLMQERVYLPSVDLVLLIHTASIPAHEVARCLKDWLESSAHTKVLCDVRADADALQHIFGIRLSGVSDVQIAHAMLSGELTSISLSPADSPFFFPTGLSRLAYEYCGEQLGAPLMKLKAVFSAVFERGGTPFRTLPLSSAALTYAASDAWHVWLVHEALRPRLDAANLAPLVLRASETRASEFRDVPDGRALWDAKLKQSRRAKAKAAGAPEKRPRDAPPAAGGEAKRRVVSGPMCAQCGVRFSGEAQLAEHRGGKHHALVAAVVARRRLVPLRLSAGAPLDEEKVRVALSEFGTIQTLRVGVEGGRANDPPFRAVLEFSCNAEAGRALGQKLLYVDGVKVKATPLSEEEAR